MTKQIKDKLIYNNEVYVIDKFVLEKQFNFDFKSGFSACWRGYIATFEVINDKFFLNDIQFLNQELNSKKEEILKNLVSDFEEKFLFKLNDILWIDSENLKMIFEIKDGILTNVLKLTHKEFNDFEENQFQKYSFSIDYEKQKKRYIEYSLNLLKTEEKKNKWLYTIFDENTYKRKIRNSILYHIQHFY